MRQSQHGKKPRSRGRKQHNPLSRVYDSSGPDVKIRGSASHIADKYLNLARDAHSSGDRIAAESYFQHAEHYLRIIAAAQAQVTAMTAQSAEYQSAEYQPAEYQPAEGAGDQPAMPQSAFRQSERDGDQPELGEARQRRGRRRNGARAGDGDGGQPDVNGEAGPSAQAAGTGGAGSSGRHLDEAGDPAAGSGNGGAGDPDADRTDQRSHPATDTLNA
jgi:hypothetical protein